MHNLEREQTVFPHLNISIIQSAHLQNTYWKIGENGSRADIVLDFMNKRWPSERDLISKVIDEIYMNLTL